MKGFIVIALTLCRFTLLAQSDPLSIKITDDTEAQIQTEVRAWIFSKVLAVPASYKSEEFYDLNEVIGLNPISKLSHDIWVNTEFDALKALFSDTTNAQIVFSDSIKTVCSDIKARFDAFEQEAIGYIIKHKFRAKNAKGESLFYDTEFVLDLDLKIRETSVRERSSSNRKTG